MRLFGLVLMHGSAWERQQLGWVGDGLVESVSCLVLSYVVVPECVQGGFPQPLGVVNFSACPFRAM